MLRSTPLIWLWLAERGWRAVETVRVWPIWSEGYRLPGGGHAVADYKGSGIGSTFNAACEGRFQDDRAFRSGDPPTWSRRRLYRTEAEARASFG